MLDFARLSLTTTLVSKVDSSYVPYFATKETESQRGSALQVLELGLWELGLKPWPVLYRARRGTQGLPLFSPWHLKPAALRGGS